MKIAAGAIAAAAAIAAGVFFLARGGSAPAAEPTTPVAVRAFLDRVPVAFGDPVTARVVVALDRSAVRPQTLHLVDDVAPFTTLAAPRTTRATSGRLQTVTVEQRVACLTAPCLARTIALPKVRVSVESRDGGTARAATAWRPVHLRSRVTAADLARSSPRFAADATPPAPHSRIPATPLQVLAALAAAAAVALLALEVRARARRRRPEAEGDELARALRLVREAEQRPAADRRRALGLLARLLRPRHDTLGRTASDLAWSRPTPETPAVDALVVDVEREQAG
jgi:hypothetical protein